MIIQHNIPAMNSYRNLGNNQNAIAGNLEKLSSGYRINRAGDDAAGLAISEKMRAQITGLDTAQKNVADGISLVRTAEGALQEVHDMLNRMSELATQSANGTYDDQVDRANLQKEVDALVSEVDRIADSANFNGISLLDGSQEKTGTPDVIAKVVTNGVDGLNVYKNEDATYYEADISAFITKTAMFSDNIHDVGISYIDANGEPQTVSYNFTYENKGNMSEILSDIAEGINEWNAVLADHGLRVTFVDGNYAAGMWVGNDSFVIEGIEPGVRPGGIYIDEDGSGTVSVGEKYCGVEAKEVEKNSGYTLFFDEHCIGDESNGPKVGDSIIVNGVTVHFTDTVPEGVEHSDDAEVSPTDVYVSIFKTASGDQIVGNGERTEDEYKLISEMTVDVAEALQRAGVDCEIEYRTSPTGLVRACSITVDDIKGDEKGGLTLQIGDTAQGFNQLSVSIQDMHAEQLGTKDEYGRIAVSIADVDISTQDGAAQAIEVIKDAINMVSDNRGTLGALQNRLDHTKNNLSVMTENIQDAESTIRDTDVAEEMMEYTKNNILIQSAQSMLGQANQLPQGILQLIG